VLFASIAAEQRERAIAIVLSDMSSNGTDGPKEIRAEAASANRPWSIVFVGIKRRIAVFRRFRN
jgi:chemotaxis response regulator CheB